jgi:hypothetical protein
MKGVANYVSTNKLLQLGKGKSVTVFGKMLQIAVYPQQKIWYQVPNRVVLKKISLNIPR